MNKKDLLGKKFGRLTVESFACSKGIKRLRTYWFCKCECGNAVEVHTNKLTSGWTKSCGCLQKDITSDRSWKGIGELSGRYINAVKHGAKLRGIEYSVTKEYLWDTYIHQNRRCALTGLPITMDCDASLDRINSENGYVVGNIQWLHRDVNLMKLDHSTERFIQICQLVIQYESKKSDNVSEPSLPSRRYGRGKTGIRGMPYRLKRNSG